MAGPCPLEGTAERLGLPELGVTVPGHLLVAAVFVLDFQVRRSRRRPRTARPRVLAACPTSCVTWARPSASLGPGRCPVPHRERGPASQARRASRDRGPIGSRTAVRAAAGPGGLGRVDSTGHPHAACPAPLGAVGARGVCGAERRPGDPTFREAETQPGGDAAAERAGAAFPLSSRFLRTYCVQRRAARRTRRRQGGPSSGRREARGWGLGSPVSQGRWVSRGGRPGQGQQVGVAGLGTPRRAEPQRAREPPRRPSRPPSRGRGCRGGGGVLAAPAQVGGWGLRAQLLPAPCVEAAAAAARGPTRPESKRGFHGAKGLRHPVPGRTASGLLVAVHGSAPPAQLSVTVPAQRRGTATGTATSLTRARGPGRSPALTGVSLLPGGLPPRPRTESLAAWAPPGRLTWGLLEERGCCPASVPGTWVAFRGGQLCAPRRVSLGRPQPWGRQHGRRC